MEPSGVTNLVYHYQDIYDFGVLGLGLLLDTALLLFTAIYDKSLTPQERIINITCAKVILVWREESTRKLRVKYKL